MRGVMMIERGGSEARVLLLMDFVVFFTLREIGDMLEA